MDRVIALLIGLFPIGIFVIVKFGIIKSWYVIKSVPGFFSARMIYGALPLGVGFIVIILAPLLPYYDKLNINIWDILFYIFIILTFVFMIAPPNWLKPKWLQWLEREHGDQLDLLVKEAQAMGRWRWEARVETQEGLEKWVKEVRRKHWV